MWLAHAAISGKLQKARVPVFLLPSCAASHGVYLATCRGLTAAEIEEKRKKKAPAYRLMVPDEDITFVDGCMGPHRKSFARLR